MNSTNLQDNRVVFQEVLRKHLKLTDQQATISMDLELDQLGLDSISAINLLFDIENEFGIVFPDELLNVETFRTGASLLQAIDYLLTQN